MKLKKLQSSPVRCSFCKEKKAYHKIVGHPYGGRTACIDCFKSLEVKENYHDDSLAEQQAYSLFKVY